jgi:hypothetical protein
MKIHDDTGDNMMIIKIKNRLDEHRLPRVWKLEDDIDTSFSKANEEAVNVIYIIFCKD